MGALQLFDGGEVGGGVLSAAWQVGNVDGGNRCVGFQAEAKIVEPIFYLVRAEALSEKLINVAESFISEFVPTLRHNEVY